MNALEMPETIWARPEHTDAPAYGPWWQTYQDEDMVAQYTRTDITQAAISRAEQAEARVKDLEVALRFYADFYENPNEGPWGVDSQDFGNNARAALAREGGE